MPRAIKGTLFGDEHETPGTTYSAFVQVVVERSVDRYPDGLTYGVPESLADLAPGERVIVPLGRSDKPTPGYVIERISLTDAPHAGDARIDSTRIKPVLKRDDAAVRLPGSLIDLARWIDRYYCAPIGMVLAAMLPGAVKRDVGRVTRRMVDVPKESTLAPALSQGEREEKSLTPPLSEGERGKKERPLSAQQKRILELLESLEPHERPIEIRDLADRAGVKTLGPTQRLLDRGLLVETVRSAITAEWIQAAADTFVPEVHTDEQSHVIDAIAPALDQGFSIHLLHGITGSGKTEVYIRLIERVLAAGKSSLVLVPEIALTPQTSGRLVGRFPDATVAILHSGLTAAQRNQQWNLVVEDEARVILGARSAVFAPIEHEQLGLIVVDEEHDSSYKQDNIPRYHGRDVAIRRAQMSKCPIVLGSATPSLESWWNATEHGQDVRTTRYHLHRLTQRIPGARLPQVRIVDFREEMRRRKDRSRVHLIGPLLESEIRTTLTAGYQALILLNRRGYANYIACPDQHCGWVMQCDACDVTMVYHLARDLPEGGYVRCHHCLAEQKLPAACPQCGKKVVKFGLGTQRVEDELIDMFPDLIDDTTMLRIDSDTMQSAKHFHDALGRFARGEVRIMLGTQMIAKGLDFPKVRLVGVINADTSINLPDFRASERTFQLVSQVAGRCGRGDSAGRVVVQSFQPGTPAIQLAAKHDYDEFARVEIALRKSCGLPPITRMARIVVRHDDAVEADRLAHELANRLRSIAEKSIRLKGAAPCPIARIAGKHRRQVEIIAPNAVSLQKLLTEARNHGWLKSDATMAVDVDPIALL